MTGDPQVAEFLFDNFPLIEAETKSICNYISGKMAESPNRLITLLSAFFAAELLRNTTAMMTNVHPQELENLTSSATVVFKEWNKTRGVA